MRESYKQKFYDSSKDNARSCHLTLECESDQTFPHSLVSNVASQVIRHRMLTNSGLESKKESKMEESDGEGRRGKPNTRRIKLGKVCDANYKGNF